MEMLIQVNYIHSNVYDCLCFVSSVVQTFKGVSGWLKSEYNS